jgi:hypothetical protein
MRKASTLIGLTLFVLGAGARAEESAPAPAPAPPAVAVPVVAAPVPAAVVIEPAPAELPPPPPGRLEVGLSFLGMGLGKVTVPVSGGTASGEAVFGYGFGVPVSYRLIAGLSLGVVPQVILDVNTKENLVGVGTNKASNEYDLLARVAYTLPIVETVALYAEVLPGYSLKSGDKWAKGPVLAFGGGVSMGLSERTFANIGVGYQMGFQKLSLGAGADYDDSESYLRIALGGGFRF